MKKYWTVALLSWQDSLVYRFNALIWVLYALVPSVTVMWVWIAAYQSNGRTAIRGFSLPAMITYYLCVSALSVAITPHPEWDIASQIRDGKITAFIVRPMSYYGYRMVAETAYQVVKTAMFLPALGVMILLFRHYLQLPRLDAVHWLAFALCTVGAYLLQTQFKFLLGISAFWVAEPAGFLEISNLLNGVLGGRMLPLALLPGWLRAVSGWMPFASVYSFPMQLLLGRLGDGEIVLGLARQAAWALALSLLVRLAWRRGLLAYEAYGG